MKYFIDTEFIEDYKKPLFRKGRYFIDLISIGIVAEDGREYYAISKEYNYNDASEWVRENVITKIYQEQVPSFKQQYMNIKTFHKYIPQGKSNKEIAIDIINFIFPSKEETNIDSLEQWKRIYSKPEFYGYYADYDWVVFCWLFGKMIDLPKGFPMYCRDLKQMLDEKANSLSSEQLSKIEYPTVTHNVLSYLDSTGELDKPKYLKTHINYPKETNEHNALSDAIWNKELYNFIISI